MEERQIQEYVIENYQGETIEIYNKNDIAVTLSTWGFLPSLSFTLAYNGKKHYSRKDYIPGRYNGPVKFVFEFDPERKEMHISMRLGEKDNLFRFDCKKNELSFLSWSK